MKKNQIKYLLGGIFFLSLGVEQAYAIPSFARQTGFNCAVCHTVFPELTQTGREFKLHGYTMNNSEKNKMFIPLSAMVMADITKSSDRTDMPKDGKIVIPQVSLFYGGKITDKSGAFVQLTYDGTELLGKTDIAHHIGMDNMDIRYADATTLANKELVYGITVNNNPTVSDLWNSVPAWGFPYASSAIANTPSAGVMADGGLGQAVGGIGAYALWNDLLYAEMAVYRSAKPGGIMGIFGWKNQDLKGDASLVQGTTPYIRIALQHSYDNSYIMLGGYTLRTVINPAVVSNTDGSLDTYNDRAVDAEYQYTNGSNSITATATKIWEKQTLDYSAANGEADNLNNSLSTTKAKVSYYYDQKYGASLGTFSTSGTADATKYGTFNASPNSRGEIAEIDYLPLQNIKLALQYTKYDKFDGASKNYDGAGRNASDNNNLYFLAWFMF
ncbi:MAG: hypothetical protein PHQ90_05200 [Sulfuricurvum sp.]|uniref:hypothetical protein n=1 Tax=Sulfuricurvum sp. TaxID=2025608 RepID=UPI002634001B|nr:hypothetical protein [Sulfuricurvum sp.]MDD2368679.1 hypothetical protein [Sulfuricurvum sp.]MDD2949464.1 hypothetical protein [Sulfuricurvum sp.]MDD5118065.1 hypothetical protein [Sulfuricurvum sp.]